MKLFQLYKSKKYLFRILFSVTVLTAIILVGASISLYYTSEQSVIRVQKEYNEATLAQINYNIHSMDEIAKNMVTSLFWDVDLRPLMMERDILVIDLVRKLRQLDTIVSASSFLHSVVVYNGNTGQLYAGGNQKFRREGSEQTQRMIEFFEDYGHVQKMKFVPMNLSGGTTGVDVFTYTMYDSLNAFQSGESALAINIKPEWLFDNIELINKLGLKQESAILLVNSDGQVLYTNGSSSIDYEHFQAVFTEQLRRNGNNGYTIHKIGDEKNIISYSQTIIPDWYVASVQPYASVIHQIEQVKKTSIGLTLLFMVLAVLASFLVSRRLYRPIERLVSQVRSSQPNDASVEGKDELAVLSDTYTEIVNHLHKANKFQRVNRDIIDTYHFRQLLTDSLAFNQERFIDMIRSNQLNIVESGSYVVIVIAIDNKKTMDQLLKPQDMKLFQFATLNIAEEMIGSGYSCIGADMRSDHLVLLVSSEQPLEEKESELMEMVHELQKTVHDYYKITISAAFSEAAFDCAQITKRYQQAQQLLQYKLIFGRESLIAPASVQNNISHENGLMPPELEKKFVEGIKSDNAEQLEDTFEKMFQYIAGCSFDQMMTSIIQVTILIRQTIREMNEHRVQPIVIDMNSVSMKVLELDSLDEIYRYLWQTVQQIREQKKSGVSDRNDILIETIKEIARNNYSDLNLSLQSIAGMMKLSADYVGRLFRKSESMSVADYINHVRLGIALELLENKSCSVNEIMEQAGFANQSYFFKLFKKKLGCTPGEYRLKKSLDKQSNPEG